jgi:uncharacterized protein
VSNKFSRAICLAAALVLLYCCGVKRDPMPSEAIFPVSIQDLKVRVVAGCADLAWSYPGAETPEKILVLRSESKNPEGKWSAPEQIAGLKGNTAFFEDCGIAPGNFYGYQVAALSKFKEQSAAGKTVRISLREIPDQPSGFTARPGDRFVDLSWQAQEGGAYNLYRSMSENYFPDRALNPQPVLKNSFSDVNLENGKTYFYCLRAQLNCEGYPPVESKCAPAKAAPIDLVPPLAPKGLAAVKMENGVQLKWFENPEPDLDGYLVYRRPKSSESWKLLTQSPIKGTEFMDGATAGLRGQFEYSVRAVDNAPSQNQSAFAPAESISL